MAFNSSSVWTLRKVRQHKLDGDWATATIPVGGLWTWGYNANGQLADSTIAHKSSPIQVGSDTSWKQLAQRYGGGAAIKNDGTLWVWGENGAGQLGDGTVVAKSSPIQVGSLTDWGMVACGNAYNLAIKTDGTLWAWGQNTNGLLGDGTTFHRSSPVKIGNMTNWQHVSCGYQHSLAIKTDGTLWSWGDPSYGSLGNNNSVAVVYSPVQVGSLSNWVAVVGGFYHNLAIKTDGTLWSWGLNDYGELGDGTSGAANRKLSPVQVGNLTNWAQVAAGYEFSLAIKTDGTLWSWGMNGSGQLGDGTSLLKSSPVQIGSLTTWRKVFASEGGSFALKTDGTLWSWGTNVSYGRLGLGDVTNRSSPVQVGSLTTWKNLPDSGCYTLYTSAIK